MLKGIQKNILKLTKMGIERHNVRSFTKMGWYKFEIYNCIEWTVEADDVEEARMILVNNPDHYADELAGASCVISDGEEVTDETGLQ